MDELLNWLGSQAAPIVIFTSVFAWAFWWVGDLWQQPERENVAEWLRSNRPLQIYRSLISGWLDRVSSFLARREILVRQEDSNEYPQSEEQILERNKSPWSWGLLDFALFLAVAYPVLSVFGQWVFSGEGRLGTLPILERSDVQDRAITSLWLVLSLLSYVLFLILESRWRYVIALVGFGIFLLFNLELQNSAGLFSLAVFLASLAVGTSAVGLAFGMAFPGATVIAVVFGVALSSGFVSSGMFGGGIVSSLAMAAGVALGMAFEWARTRLEQNQARPVVVLFWWLVPMYLCLAVSTIWMHTDDRDAADQIAGLLMFLGFLPILNAVADFLSTGLTRHFLGIGARGNPWLYGFFDLVAGIVTFFGLGCSMIATVALVSAIGGPALIDLDVVLGDATVPGSVLQDPHAYWWLYVTFLSTLLPTAIHAFITCFAFIAMWPGALREWIANGLQTGQSWSGKPASLTLATLIALSAAVPFSILWYGGEMLMSHYPAIGETLVSIFRRFAMLTGAV